MLIGGLQKTTLVDFPGTVACTVFTQGCPFRCHFCHNPELVLSDQFNPIISEREIFDFLHDRLGKISGVCITGGEPLMQNDIEKFISHIKSIGFKVKLDTNGYYPKKLKSIIDSGDIDYIAMDIKAPLGKYRKVTNIQDTRNKIQTNSNNQTSTSINLIMNLNIDYEFRTTVAKPLHNIDDIISIGKLIKGAKKYYIQNYVKSKQINEKMNLEPFSDEELEKVVKKLKKSIDLVEAR